MHLKRLIVHGFKSFADRTEFEFGAGGLTCIVGPNGCGKSNVLDAVKWVLGEQRPTSLRGKEMTDVVFNGTIRRPPMGLCEGTLIFDNADRTLPIEEPELRLTRRVYRTGETEYQINGRGVRLKDIRDVFAGTGLGTGGYGFMEQGKIDSILAGNAVDRRRVFEEAAGISRFRARKHETELKLQKVEENLTRLADVVEEINRQIRSLRVHAGKARSHRVLTLRLRSLQRRFALHRFDTLREQQGSSASELVALGSARDAGAETHRSLRADLHGVEGELEGLVRAVADARTRYAEVSGLIAATKDKIVFHGRYKDELAARTLQRREESDEAEAQLRTTKEDRVVILREREALERDQARAEARRRHDESQVEVLRERVDEFLAAQKDAETGLHEFEHKKGALLQDAARAETGLAHLADRRERLQAGLLASELARAEIRESLEERSHKQDVQTSALEGHRAALTDEERRSEDLDRVFGDAQDEIRRLDAEIGRIQARREIIEGHLKRREGLDEGTRLLLEERERDPSFLPGFQGLLLDLFDVDLAEARAVEAALGDAAQALVVADANEALKGLDFLQARGKGGALFLPADRFKVAGRRALPGIRAGSAEIGRILQLLIGGIEVVSRKSLAQRMSGDESVPALLASTDGLLVRDGRVVSSPRGGEASPGLVVLASEAKDLSRRIPEFTAQREIAANLARDLREKREDSRMRVKELSVALLKEEGEAARLDQEIVRLVRELDRATSEISRSGDDLRELQGEIDRSTRAHDGIRESLRAVEVEIEGRLAAVGGQRELVFEHRDELDRSITAGNESRVAEITILERLDAAKAREVHLDGMRADLERRLDGARRDLEEMARAAADALATLAEEQVNLSALVSESETTAARLDERERAADGVREGLRAVQERLEEVEGRLAEIAERQADARAEEGRLQAEMDGLLRHTREELSLDLADPEAVAMALAEEAPAGLPVIVESEDPVTLEGAVAAAIGVTPEPPGADAGAPAGTEWAGVEAEVRSLKERIIRLGNVNLAAVEELETAEERAQFITRERNDLERGREELLKVLQSIEVQSTQLFLDTFNAVREHFIVIFRRLFGGGRSDIRLENPEQPLECGIEIMAQPPGKEVKTITQLSGGERTMTAVAMLFAIFRAHPAPCAFLDEVDAALDEDNTERFVRLVEESRQAAQFIVVTHSKRTMEHADLLYGVTMPERGVSRRVAVRLEQMDEQGHIRDLEAVNRAAAREAAAEVLVRSAGTSPAVTAPALQTVVPEIVPDEIPHPQRAPIEAPALARRARALRPKKAKDAGPAKTEGDSAPPLSSEAGT